MPGSCSVCPACQRRFSRPRSRRFWSVLAAVMFLLPVLIWSCRQPLLTAVAEHWTVTDPLVKADAILVLGGGADVRPMAAAQLYRDGFASRILITSPPLKPTMSMGLAPAHGSLNREVLLRQGIPEAAIEMVALNAANTHQEALATQAWMQAHAAQRVIIPTEYIHSRRVKWQFQKLLAPAGMSAVVHAIKPLEYAAADWWQHEEGLLAFQAELLKYVYYRLKY